MFAFLILAGSAAGARAQDTSTSAPSTLHPWSVGTSMFMLMNLAFDDQLPHFYQVNVGYQLTPKDRLSIEAITWRRCGGRLLPPVYYYPLGIPWGEEGRDSADTASGSRARVQRGSLLPGHADKGSLLVDQRDAVLSALLRRTDEKIDNGLQLYLAARIGYHFRVGHRRFLEPSVAFTFWPRLDQRTRRLSGAKEIGANADNHPEVIYMEAAGDS